MKKLLSVLLTSLMFIAMNAQKCAVLEFNGASSLSVADFDGISEMFMTYFHPLGYTMVDRIQINKIISEQGFQRSSMTDEQMVRLGKILNVSKVVVGKVSFLGGKYQVDARVVDVELAQDIAFEGATFTGDYRTDVRDFASKLAQKIAIADNAKKSSNALHQANTVDILYGYLKVFPEELGYFSQYPRNVIAKINDQAMYGYNNWRIPTKEEIAVLKEKGYLHDKSTFSYMTSREESGIVLLVSSGEDYTTIQAREQAKAAEEKRKAEEDTKRKEAEAQHKANVENAAAKLAAEGWIDLGLPSGTLWKNKDEKGYFLYNEAKSKYANNLPTIQQLKELKTTCKWQRSGNGYDVKGPNGNSIYLPINGIKECDGSITYNRTAYISADAVESVSLMTKNKCKMVETLEVSFDEVNILAEMLCVGASVRIVKKP